MKKVFSLLAVLAIIVGVTSAYTTAPSSDIDVVYEAWYVKQNQFQGATPPTSATADANKRGSAALATSPSFFDVNSTGSCTLDTQNICVVLIKYEDGTAASATIEDYRLGDSPHAN